MDLLRHQIAFKVACIVCKNWSKYDWSPDNDELIRNCDNQSICRKHQTCMKCRSQLTPEEIKLSSRYDTGVCSKHLCCQNPWKFLDLCPVCQKVVICKDCGKPDQRGGYMCENCFHVLSYYDLN